MNFIMGVSKWNNYALICTVVLLSGLLYPPRCTVLECFQFVMKTTLCCVTGFVCQLSLLLLMLSGLTVQVFKS